MTRRFHIFAVAGSLALAACGRDPAPTGGSPLLTSTAASAPAPVDLARAGREVAELRRAAGMPIPGSHRLKITAKTQLVEGGQVAEELSEEAVLEVAADRAYHGRYSNSKEYGREVFSSAGMLWIRPLYGKFHKRPPASADEPARVAAEIAGTFAAHLELVGPAAQLTDGGRADVGGRPGRRVRIGFAGERGAGGAAAWRREARVEALDGEVVLDEKTGAPLSGRLRARVAFTRDGHPLEMRVESTQTVTDLGAEVAVAAPPDSESVATPLRGTEFEEREELLSGIAPPARKAPTPSVNR